MKRTSPGNIFFPSMGTIYNKNYEHIRYQLNVCTTHITHCNNPFLLMNPRFRQLSFLMKMFALFIATKFQMKITPWGIISRVLHDFMMVVVIL